MGIATYLALSGSVLALLLVLLRRFIDWKPRTWRILVLHLIPLTIIFDGLIISVGIVAYDPTKILGIYIGPSPIEDFIYTIAAIALVPALWNFFDKRRHYV